MAAAARRRPRGGRRLRRGDRRRDRALAATGIPSGESGAAALAGAALLAADAAGAALLQPRDAAGATPQAASRGDAVILLLDTEGVTDPERYEAIVGLSAPS